MGRESEQLGWKTEKLKTERLIKKLLPPERYKMKTIRVCGSMPGERFVCLFCFVLCLLLLLLFLTVNTH